MIKYTHHRRESSLDRSHRRRLNVRMGSISSLPPLPAQPKDTPWPTQTWPIGDVPNGTDRQTLDRLIDTAFTDLDTLGQTHAFIAIQSGEIVKERYAEGYGADDTYHSWSMAKSMTHALVSLAVEQGALSLDAPVKVPEWQDPDDPRASITLDQLLRMSSGLQFTEDYENSGISHTIEMLFGSGSDDVAHFAANLPLEHKPGTFWSYSSGTTNIICRLLAETLNPDRDGFEAFMRDKLLAPIGMSSAQPKFDAAGTFLGSSFCFCTARDFARFGLLYMRGGLWDGVQVLPKAWIDQARTPTPNVPDDEPMGYGAYWWLNMAGPGSFSANGYDGQYIVLVPEKDLILVRHGASEAHKDNVRAWLADVAACFK